MRWNIFLAFLPSLLAACQRPGPSNIFDSVIVGPGPRAVALRVEAPSCATPLKLHSDSEGYAVLGNSEGPRTLAFDNGNFHLFKTRGEKLHHVGSFPLSARDNFLSEPGLYTVVVNNTAKTFEARMGSAPVVLKPRCARVSGEGAEAFQVEVVYDRFFPRTWSRVPATWNGEAKMPWVKAGSALVGFLGEGGGQPRADFLTYAYRSPSFSDLLRDGTQRKLAFDESGAFEWNIDASWVDFRMHPAPVSREFPAHRFADHDLVRVPRFPEGTTELKIDPTQTAQVRFIGTVDLEINGQAQKLGPIPGVRHYMPATLGIVGGTFSIAEGLQSTPPAKGNVSVAVPESNAPYFDYLVVFTLREADRLQAAVKVDTLNGDITRVEMPVHKGRFRIHVPSVKVADSVVHVTSGGGPLLFSQSISKGETYEFEDFVGEYGLWLAAGAGYFPFSVAENATTDVYLGTIQVPDSVQKFDLGVRTAGSPWTPLRTNVRSDRPILALPGVTYVLRLYYLGADSDEYEERTVVLRNSP